MDFPFPFIDVLVIPTGAGPGDERIEIDGNEGEIRVYNLAGNLEMVIGRPPIILAQTSETIAGLTDDAGWGSIFGSGVAGTTRRWVTTFQGLEVNSGAQAFIRFYSESEDHTVPPVIEFGSFDGGLAGVRGPRIVLPAGTNRPIGSSTLVAGTVTVTNALIRGTTAERIFLSRRTPGTAPGHLSYTIAAGSFTINSTSATDDAIINWLILSVDN